MATYRIADVAKLLGVSDDTARRWAESGKFATTTDEGGRRAVEGAELARFAATLHDPLQPGPVVQASARNRLVGIVTRVLRDAVMAQVDVQAGPHRFVSLLSREAVDELGLEPGVLAVAVVKATNVSVEIPAPR